MEAARLILGRAGPNQTTPVVALTANAFDEQRIEWERAGGAGFLTKPINSALMIETILKLTARPSGALDDPADDKVVPMRRSIAAL